MAAGLAAVYPAFWVYERALLSETLLLAFIAVFVFLVYRFERAPTLGYSILLGLGVGLLALVRSEQLLLGAVVVAPLILTARSVPVARRVGWLAVAGLTALLVLAPWAAYNTATFDRFVPFTTGSGNAMIAASCDLTFEGDRLGYYDSACTLAARESYVTPGPERDSAQRSAAMDYVGDHLDRLPVVVLAREGRVWGIYRPGQMVDFMAEWTATPVWVIGVWFAMYYTLLVSAVAGAVVMRRRGSMIWPFVVMAGIVTLSAALTFGETRYRAGIEVPLVIVAAFAFDALWGWRRGREGGLDVPARG